VTGRSIALFIAAAIAEIGGAYLVWLGIKEYPLTIHQTSLM
jgi:small multidrug resistance family-3 protein